MKPVDVKSSRYVHSSKEINNKDPKFKIVDIVKISKNNSIFAKVQTPNGSEEFLQLKWLKMLHHGHMLLLILMQKKRLEHFTKTNQK